MNKKYRRQKIIVEISFKNLKSKLYDFKKIVTIWSNLKYKSINL